jgi:hypothetical protein
VDFSEAFAGSAADAWQAEYDAHVLPAFLDSPLSPQPLDALLDALLMAKGPKKRSHPRRCYREEDLDAVLEEEALGQDEWPPADMEGFSW